MATQYTSILKLALPVQGELSGTWGDVVNDNITSMVEEAIAGRAVINTWTANSHTLTTADGTTSESRAAILTLTDTGTALTGAGTVICPAASKIYIVENGTGQTITVKTSSGTGVAVPNTKNMVVFCDGTNVEEGITNINSLTLNGDGATVSSIKDEDNMASDSATALATQQSIKAYVDSQVGSFDTLAEVLAQGNTTGGTDIAVGTGDDITFADSSKVIFGAGSDVSIYSDGTDGLITSTGNLTLDVAGDIILDADSGAWRFKDGGGSIVEISVGSGSSPTFYSPVSDADIVFKGNDGGSTITALTLDMSAAGVATFNDAVRVPAGSVGSPTITNSADTNTGLYWPGADQVGFAVAGSRKFYVSSTQAFFQNLSSGVSLSGGLAAEGGAVFNDGSADVDFRVESNTNSHMLFVDAGNDRIGVGTGSPQSTLHLSATAPIISFTDTNSFTDVNDRFIVRASTDVGNIQWYDDSASATANLMTFKGTEVAVNDSSANIDFRVESDANDHMLFVDAGNDRVGIGTGVPDTTLHVASTSSGGVLTIESTSSNNSAGPNILLYRSSSTPAADDNLGKIIYRGTNSAAEDVNYVSVDSTLTSPTDGAEQGQYDIQTMVDGTSRSRLRINNSELVINDGSRDLDFRVESDTNTHMLFVDAGADKVAVGTSSPQQVLHILSSAITYMRATGGSSNTGIDFGQHSNASGYIWHRDDAAVIIGTNETERVRFGSSTAGETVLNEGSNDFDFRVESNTNTHALYLDAGTSKIGINTSSPDFMLEVGDPNSGVAADIAISSGGTTEKRLVFKRSTVEDFVLVEDASENLSLNAGLSGKEFVINNTSTDLDFRVESDSNTHALFVDAGNNRVGILDSAPSYPLDVTGAIHSTTNVIIGDSSSSPGTLTLNDNSGTAYTLAFTGTGTRAFEMQGSASSGAYGLTMTNLGTGAFNLSVDGVLTVGESTSPFSNDALVIRGQQDGTAIKFEAGGTHRFDLDCNGTGTDNLSFNDTNSDKLFTIYRSSEVVVNEDSKVNVDFRVESAAYTHMFVVDASTNKVGINKSAPDALFEAQETSSTVFDATDTAGQAGSGATLSVQNLSDDTNAFSQLLLRTRNTSKSVSRIASLVNGTGTDLVFVNEDQGSSPAERMRIRKQGQVIIPGGVTLGTSANVHNDANTLDDYEEGTWTPTYQGSSTAGTGTYTRQNGTYVKVGNLVYASGTIGITAHTGSGNAQIAGLPFSSFNSTGNYAAVSISFNNGHATTSGYQIIGFVQIPTTTIYLYETGGTGQQNPLALDTGFTEVDFTIMYRAA